MNIIRAYILREFTDAEETFGYITKAIRFENNIKKTHANDAFVISGGIIQEKTETVFYKLRRKNNRSLQKNRNGFARSIRRQRYFYQPHDMVEFNGKIYRVVGTMNKGKSIQMIEKGKKFTKNPIKLRLNYHSKGMVKC